MRAPTRPEGAEHVDLDSHTLRRASPRGVIALVLLAVALVFAVLYLLADNSEHHSYNAGAAPSATYRVTEGQLYEISVPGGIDALTARGVSIDQFNCTWTGNGTTANLPVTALGAGTRTVHAVATFTAPTTGNIAISCSDLPAVYVDDADNSPADSAGRDLLIATIALTIAAALGMSALYQHFGRSAATGDQDEVERPIERPAELFGFADEEVVDPDGGDVPG